MRGVKKMLRDDGHEQAAALESDRLRQQKTDGEKVRAAWEHVVRCDGSYRDYIRGTILIQQVHGQWLDFESWTAALSYTEAHAQKIADIDEEITYEETARDSYSNRGYDAHARILSRLQAARTELTRGWRGRK